MVYVRNGRVLQNAGKGPWPLCLIPGFGLLVSIWNAVVVFCSSIFRPSAAFEAKKRNLPRSSRFHGSGGSGGGDDDGGSGGGGGGGGVNRSNIGGIGNLPSSAASTCASCG